MIVLPTSCISAAISVWSINSMLQVSKFPALMHRFINSAKRDILEVNICLFCSIVVMHIP